MNFAFPQTEGAEPRANIDRLRADVTALTSTKIPRSYENLAGLKEAAKYIENEWKKSGLKVAYQKFKAGKNTYENVVTTMGPSKGPRIVIGAHYDVAGPLPGADDNASGIAGLLEIARLIQQRKPTLKYRIDLVAYTLEEPPFFGSDQMGSAVHAKSLKELKAEVLFMLSLEMVGYFSDKKNSQSFPIPELAKIYPSTGNFIGVVGDPTSKALVTQVTRLMKQASKVDVQALNAPRELPGVSLSDHSSYWEYGYPAIMLTDTAFMRNPHYHTKGDTADTLDYKSMAEVVEGVYNVLINFSK
ncbi:M28 family peptidase [Bdellovibrio reynosensis]|uniref:M28 family peptidase n=1 Tax=Bdellovibrio reynosensis TaxID=2835041 RepID=A0ABY4CEH8_9BACT|nr:M28 family peptidase [Bdellovibrio reynosensis]UOF00610.1 M28 family peptidase [Bdellovibrio reynosensis]